MTCEIATIYCDDKGIATGGYVDIYTYYAGYGALVIEDNTFAD